MALPTVLQMLYGRARLIIEPIAFDENGIRLLRCEIINKPVARRFLRRLGVRREQANASVTFSVREEGTGRPLVSNIVPLLYSQGRDPAARITVSPSQDASAWFTIAVVDRERQEAYLVCDTREGGEDRLPLDEGLYALILVSDVDGFVATNELAFAVGRAHTQDALAWIER